jgi:cobaltochelatase CobN
MLSVSKPVTVSLHTKRQVIGQVLMCCGCCCGDVERGRPEVPVEWLKAEWRRRGLIKDIDLSFSGCLGPCDLANVVSVSDDTGSVWLGQLKNPVQYLGLLEWAFRSKEAGLLLPLPAELEELRFDRFRAKAVRTREESAWTQCGSSV